VTNCLFFLVDITREELTLMRKAFAGVVEPARKMCADDEHVSSCRQTKVSDGNVRSLKFRNKITWFELGEKHETLALSKCIPVICGALVQAVNYFMWSCRALTQNDEVCLSASCHFCDEWADGLPADIPEQEIGHWAKFPFCNARLRSRTRRLVARSVFYFIAGGWRSLWVEFSGARPTWFSRVGAFLNVMKCRGPGP